MQPTPPATAPIPPKQAVPAPRTSAQDTGVGEFF